MFETPADVTLIVANITPINGPKIKPSENAIPISACVRRVFM